MTAVGIVGLGLIGGGVARALAGKEFRIRGYDIRPEAFERLPKGVERAASAAGAATASTWC